MDKHICTGSNKKWCPNMYHNYIGCPCKEPHQWNKKLCTQKLCCDKEGNDHKRMCKTCR